MDDVCNAVALDHVEQARHVEHVAELDVDLVEEVANEPLVAMAGEDDGAVSFLHDPAARLRADDAHPAGDQDFHARSRLPRVCLPRIRRSSPCERLSYLTLGIGHPITGAASA